MATEIRKLIRNSNNEFISEIRKNPTDVHQHWLRNATTFFWICSPASEHSPSTYCEPFAGGRDLSARMLEEPFARPLRETADKPNARGDILHLLLGLQLQHPLLQFLRATNASETDLTASNFRNLLILIGFADNVLISKITAMLPSQKITKRLNNGKQK